PSFTRERAPQFSPPHFSWAWARQPQPPRSSLTPLLPHPHPRFRVNFSCGPEKGADIALHFNPRFDSGDKIVLNSFQQGKWAKEEHKHDMPFHKGQHFEMVFNITPEGYRFRHRIPPERVQVVDVDGDLELQSLNVIGGAGASPGSQPCAPTRRPCFSTDWASPIKVQRPGVSGYRLVCPALPPPPKATPPSRADDPPTHTLPPASLVLCLPSFCINFKMGYSKDIALHINPRLNEKRVIRNSFLNGKWGSEERELPHNPFQPGQYFELSIRCGNGRFKVFANGQPLFDYNHRFREFQRIDTLEINGDVVLSYVQF
uniref:Galectin n=1 Tax=Terrapene triunguis TaxID=2587831 RepID=A0A674IGF1_9SAUR